jgi:hypothetical protein
LWHFDAKPLGLPMILLLKERFFHLLRHTQSETSIQRWQGKEIHARCLLASLALMVPSLHQDREAKWTGEK